MVVLLYFELIGAILGYLYFRSYLPRLERGEPSYYSETSLELVSNAQELTIIGIESV